LKINKCGASQTKVEDGSGRIGLVAFPEQARQQSRRERTDRRRRRHAASGCSVMMRVVSIAALSACNFAASSFSCAALVVARARLVTVRALLPISSVACCTVVAAALRARFRLRSMIYSCVSSGPLAMRYS
jgi:hypothetical protein